MFKHLLVASVMVTLAVEPSLSDSDPAVKTAEAVGTVYERAAKVPGSVADPRQVRKPDYG